MSRTADEHAADIVGVVVDTDNIVDLIVGASQEQLDLRIPLDKVHGDHDGRLWRPDPRGRAKCHFPD